MPKWNRYIAALVSSLVLAASGCAQLDAPEDNLESGRISAGLGGLHDGGPSSRDAGMWGASSKARSIERNVGIEP